MQCITTIYVAPSQDFYLEANALPLSFSNLSCKQDCLHFTSFQESSKKYMVVYSFYWNQWWQSAPFYTSDRQKDSH